MFTAKLRREQYIDFPHPSWLHMCTAAVSASFSFYVKHKNPDCCSEIGKLEDVMLCDVSLGGVFQPTPFKLVPTLEKWLHLYRLDNLCCMIHAEPCSLESPSTFRLQYCYWPTSHSVNSQTSSIIFLLTSFYILSRFCFLAFLGGGQECCIAFTDK